MTAQTTSVKTPPRQLGRSILAVFLGFLAVVVLSLLGRAAARLGGEAAFEREAEG